MMNLTAAEAAVTEVHNQAQNVLTFWFDDHGKDDWFSGSQAFDAEVRMAFATTLQRAAKAELWQWRSTARGRLAEIIVLDQFSRQLHRNSAHAFQNDPLALMLAQELVERDDLSKLAETERPFALMPYMHSESLAIHDAALPLFEKYTNEDTLKFEIAHRDLIEKFGRYPKRNEALGRASTKAELAYIAERGGSMF